MLVSLPLCVVRVVPAAIATRPTTASGVPEAFPTFAGVDETWTSDGEDMSVLGVSEEEVEVTRVSCTCASCLHPTLLASVVAPACDLFD